MAGTQASEALALGPLQVGVLLTLLPAVLLSMTSFVKLSVVLSLLRNALGVGNVPSTLVISLWALLLSLHVMGPVFDQVVARGTSFVQGSPEQVEWMHRPLSMRGWGAWSDFGAAVAPPVRGFLLRHAGQRELALFRELALERSGADPGGFAVLLPAFLITELSEALSIGFMLFLPFLVVDLLVTIVLTALGVTGLSTAVVALPFKLVLFVVADGFYVLSKALVAGYF